MKKYTLFSFVFILSFIFLGFLGFNVNPASAESPVPQGCTSTRGYSSTTGIKCDSYVIAPLPQGCVSTSGYSVTTGEKCDSFVWGSFPAGCTSTQGYSTTTGVKCDSLINSSLPLGCTSTRGFSPVTGQRCDNSPTPVTPNYLPGCYSYSGYSQTTGYACDGSSTTTEYSLAVNNTYATLGTPIKNSNGLIIGYNYKMSLTLNNNGYSDLFLRNKNDGTDISAVIDPAVSSVTYRRTSSTAMSGDVSGVSLVIPARGSRSLDFSGQLLSQGQTGQVTYRITSLTYGNSAYNPNGFSLGSGLDNLMVTADFGSNNISQPSFTVLSPNGREDWNSTTDKVITWKKNDSLRSGTVYANLLFPDGSTCYIGAKDINLYSMAVNFSRMACVNTARMIPAGQYKILLSVDEDWAVATSDKRDSSDTTFNLTASPETPSVGTATVSATLDSGYEDRTGSWHVFSPNGSSDWNWTMQFNISEGGQKTIKSVTVLNGNGYEGWGTNLDNIDIGKGHYPLVVARSDGSQLVDSYNRIIGNYASGTYIFKLYGQRGGSFNSGKLIVRFTDGTSITSPITTSSSNTQPSITVLSPNGGESYTSDQIISVGFMGSSGQRTYINLVAEDSAFDLVSYNNYYYHNINDPYYPVTAGGLYDTTAVLHFPKDWVASRNNKSFKIEICSANHCDKSDSYFAITAPTTTTNYHSADTNKDGRIVLSEVLAFGATFGNIPAYQVANTIYKRGEFYSWNNSGIYEWKDASGHVITESDIATANSITDPKVTSSPSVVASGQSVTLSYTIPSDAVSAKLYLSCPTGVSMPYGNGGNENCNTWIDWTPPGNLTSSIFTVINNTSTVQNVVPNFYIYRASNPNYAVGVSSQITVNPR